MSEKKLIFHVISHTHWDREWYLPLEKFRRRLVNLIDNLLDILEEYPDYIFHLDAQTIVLRDYLEIRPHKEEILKKYIKNGNVLVGPWYVQNDFYLTSGEATIRNLLYGSEMAAEFGKCSRVGYAPDQFGNISQLPQILKDFQSDSFVFGRGYSGPSEFIWEGADGSRLFAFYMAYWYNNCQRLPEESERALKIIEGIEKSFEGIAVTPYLLLMNGVDHLEAQENLPPIIEKLNQLLPSDKKIEQTSLRKYIDDVKKYISESKLELTVHKGELRDGNDGNVLQNTCSSRIYLKTDNAKIQNLIENKLEPLYTMLSMAGTDSMYDKQYFDYIWKLLLENHPHDSICGCSIDMTHNQMESRNERLFALIEDFLAHGMEFLQSHIDKTGISADNYLITLCNSLERPFTGVFEARVEIPVSENVDGFEIVDMAGNKVPFELVSIKEYAKNFFSPINLPGGIAVKSFKVRLFAENLPPFSFNHFIVCPVSKVLTVFPKPQKQDSGIMENEYLQINIDNGEISLYDKKTKISYPDILAFEDTEDIGDAYVFGSKGFPCITNPAPTVECLEKTFFTTIYRLTYDFKLPVRFDRKTESRAEETVSNQVVLTLKLDRSSEILDMNFTVDNHSEDHRLRAVFRSGIDSDFTDSLIPFDIVKRDKRCDRNGMHNNDHPNSGFVDISDGKKGLGILTEGVYEWNHLKNRTGEIAFTLMRSTFGFGDYGWLCKGTQCKCTVSMRMALRPHCGSSQDSEMPYRAKLFQNPPIISTNSADERKFAGGRPVVQASEITDQFFRPDPYESLQVESSCSFVTVEGAEVSAFKKAHDGDGYILRIWNSSTDTKTAKISFIKKVNEIFLSTMEELSAERLISENNCVKLTLDPKKIVTLRVHLSLKY